MKEQEEMSKELLIKKRDSLEQRISIAKNGQVHGSHGGFIPNYIFIEIIKSCEEELKAIKQQLENWHEDTSQNSPSCRN